MIRTVGAVCVFALLNLLNGCSEAQSGGKVFDKTYPVNGRPDLQVVIDNSAVHAQSCGSCQSIHIHLDTNDFNLSDFTLQEGQTGNTVHFSLKNKEKSWWNQPHGKGPMITIALPAQSDVDAQSSNGKIEVAGISGAVNLHTDNGKLEVTDSQGALHLTTSNGAIQLVRSNGDVKLRTDNGTIDATGHFNSAVARTDNGAIHLTAENGSSLAGGMQVKTDNGAVQVSVPRDVHVNVDLRTSLGSVRNGLPLSGQTSSEEHHVQGSMNGGGAPLQVSTDNGSITVNTN